MRIAVLLGGISPERNVSLASGARVVTALRSRGHQVSAVDPARGVLDDKAVAAILAGPVGRTPPTSAELAALAQHALLPRLATLPAVRDADVVFNALHGGAGEDGTVQALLDAVGVRYTGSGVLASAVAMDKDIAKTLMRAAGVTTPDWLMAPVSADRVGDALGFPVIVKPSKVGSTVGLTLVREPVTLAAAIAAARAFDDEVMCEQFIAGRELTVAVVDGDALPVGEILPAHELYDYECKYTPGMAREEFPARLAPAEAAAVQAQARRAYKALKLGGCARIDFRMAADGTFYCLEANTLPGLTALSLVPQAAAAAGIEFPELCERLVRTATRPREDTAR
jgi:D-alanine-D-alanine ligase